MTPEDCWWEQRYLDAVFADHEKGHPGRQDQMPIGGCPDCANEQLNRDSATAIQNAERLAKGQ